MAQPPLNSMELLFSFVFQYRYLFSFPLLSRVAIWLKPFGIESRKSAIFKSQKKKKKFTFCFSIISAYVLICKIVLISSNKQNVSYNLIKSHS